MISFCYGKCGYNACTVADHGVIYFLYAIVSVSPSGFMSKRFSYIPLHRAGTL